MNVLYAKSLLLAYPNLDAVISQIDELVERKALSSMSDTSPAFFQCKSIVDFTAQKHLLIQSKLIIGDVLKKFSEEEIECIDYKYFKSKPRNCFVNLDTTSRSYFRRQIKIIKKFAEWIERAGIDDVRFEKEFLSIDFFKELLRRVKEYEISSMKNPALKLAKKKNKMSA